MTAALDPLSFAETICGHPVGYIRVETIEGKRTCILIDEDGEVIALSEYGMSPLISLAAHHGWELLTVH